MGYHIVNLIFHIGSVFLLYLIIKAMLGGFYISLASALIFAVHPFNSEVVNYITARSSVMSGFFYLLAFYCWVKFRSKKIEDRSKKLEVRSQTKSNILPLTSNFSPGSYSASSLTSNFLLLTSNFLPLTSYDNLNFFVAVLIRSVSTLAVLTVQTMVRLYDLYFI